MKKFKKIMAVLVAAIMIVAMTVPAWAALPSNGSVTVDNALEGETYTLYKIFDLSYGANASGQQNVVVTPSADSQNDIEGKWTPIAYTYTDKGSSDPFLTALQADTSPFTVTQIQSTGVYNVVRKSDASVTDAVIITWVKDHLTDLNATAITPTVATNSGSVSWTGLGYGYYYVTSTMGSLITIDSTNNTATVKEKNTTPTVEKFEKDTEAAEWATTVNSQITEKIEFKIDVTDGKGTNGYVVIHDKMSAGLTLDTGSFKVLKNGGELNSGFTVYVSSTAKKIQKATPTVTVNSTYDLNTTPIRETMGSTPSGEVLHAIDTDTFVVVLDKTTMSGAALTDKLTVTYDAYLNEDALDTTNDTNVTKISYSKQNSEEVTNTVKTYAVDLLKYRDGDANETPLPGALFELESSDGTALWLKKLASDSTHDYYVIADNQSLGTNHAGHTAINNTGGQDTATVLGYKNDSTNVEYYSIIKTADKQIKIIGLDLDKNYNLDEVEAPAGYYQLTSKQALTKTESAFNDTKIANKTGVELPSTGGMGTTVLYIVGGMLIILAGAYLFFSRKRTA